VDEVQIDVVPVQLVEAALERREAPTDQCIGGALRVGSRGQRYLPQLTVGFT